MKAGCNPYGSVARIALGFEGAPGLGIDAVEPIGEQYLVRKLAGNSTHDFRAAPSSQITRSGKRHSFRRIELERLHAVAFQVEANALAATLGAIHAQMASFSDRFFHAAT